MAGRRGTRSPVRPPVEVRHEWVPKGIPAKGVPRRYECPHCRMWTANVDNQEVCPARDRRKLPGRRELDIV